MEESDFIKITNTVYKILDFLPENDPLKNRAKERAISILENATLISGTSGWVSLQKEKASAQVLDDIGVLCSYLEIGKKLGWIDAMNFFIITKEYNIIKSGITPPVGIIKKSIEIGYGIPLALPKTSTTVSVTKNVVGENAISQKYSPRQEKILKILAEKEKAQVADFIKELPNITKRTIRRDLDDLLKRGKVLRVGEWNQVFYQKSDRT